MRSSQQDRQGPTTAAFYFDFISPYAYVAWAHVRASSELAAVVDPVPVLFAALLDAHEQKGPAEIPAKRAYTVRDAYRKAHRLGLPPLVPPPTHPFNPLLALRAASLPLERADKLALIDALFAAAWAHGTGVESPEAVARAASRAGLDGNALVEAAQVSEIKEQLRAATADAVARGVFGVPTLRIDEELFWGTDGVDFALAYLRGSDPVPKDLSWADRPASALRRALR